MGTCPAKQDTVSSADFMAIYAANNLFKGIHKYSNSGGALLGGVRLSLGDGIRNCKTGRVREHIMLNQNGRYVSR